MTDDDSRYRSAYRDEAPVRDSLLADTIDVAVRRIVTGLVIAGALIGAGIYLSEPSEPARYQVTTTSDGRVIRLNTDSGSLVACEGNDCWLLQRGSSGLRERDDTPEQESAPEQEQESAQLPPPDTAPAPTRQEQPEPATR